MKMKNILAIDSQYVVTEKRGNSRHLMVGAAIVVGLSLALTPALLLLASADLINMILTLPIFGCGALIFVLRKKLKEPQDTFVWIVTISAAVSIIIGIIGFVITGGLSV